METPDKQQQTPEAEEEQKQMIFVKQLEGLCQVYSPRNNIKLSNNNTIDYEKDFSHTRFNYDILHAL